ncbi:hypothetical protein [Shewanella oncorhynchi]|uniref:hypothetical protein n=1 Tax=Shewanella oncorhynchi TaxID=2726434 RepID=UPI003D7B3A8D
MEISLLADNPSAIDMVASWYFNEWCQDNGSYTKEEVVEKVSASINRDTAPILIIGKVNGVLAGSAELKIR